MRKNGFPDGGAPLYSARPVERPTLIFQLILPTALRPQPRPTATSAAQPLPPPPHPRGAARRAPARRVLRPRSTSAPAAPGLNLTACAVAAASQTSHSDGRAARAPAQRGARASCCSLRAAAAAGRPRAGVQPAPPPFESPRVALALTRGELRRATHTYTHAMLTPAGSPLPPALPRLLRRCLRVCVCVFVPGSHVKTLWRERFPGAGADLLTEARGVGWRGC